ncbi:DUF2948 family protein [Brevundimonas sp. 2R-24]|uniref:DUF2948 family protein n=1 Tax=Peiella sedimenti TaxID=3061083 RepID=A0ABT8SP49_9CAUL|nr:DUF2948 family protein [Caulobacteraceae bacterium XZ-24]
MSGAQDTGLHLLAQDAGDLELISAALQDAVCLRRDILLEAKGRRLTFAFNRLRREAGRERERVRSGLQLGGVLGVRSRGLTRDRRAVLQLLALTFRPEIDGPGGVLGFRFAGGADLEAQVECVDAVLADLTGGWPARGVPDHGADIDG